MKGTPRSLWLSMAHQAAGWWMGMAANAIRRQQRAMMAKAAKPSPGKNPKRSPSRRSGGYKAPRRG